LVIVGVAAGNISLRPNFDTALVRQLLAWALPLGVATLIFAVYSRIDIVLLSKLASNEQVALYGLAYRVVDGLAVLPQFVLVTLLPEFARLSAKRGRFDELLQKVFGGMQVAALAVVVPVVLFARETIDLIGGSGFRGGAPVLQLLMVGVALSFLSATIGQAFVALNRQDRLVPMTLGVLVANVSLNLALIPVWGASGAALALALSEALHLALLWLFYRDFATPPRFWMRARVLAAACAMTAAVAVKLLPVSGDGGLMVTLGLGGPLAVSVYVAALYALNAMPSEVHSNLLLPLWNRLKVAGAAART
jgi:O-antigen/teichoic acid export membrane protein